MRWLTVLLTTLLAAPLAACGGGGGGSSLPGTPPPAATEGTLRVLVTDAPFPYDYVESAVITIEEVRVRDASAAEDEGWVTVFTGPVDVDLVPLTNGVSMVLVEADLPPGTYDQVRVLVDAGEVRLTPDAVVEDGDPIYNVENGRLKFPSASQSGLKVRIQNDIEVVTALSSDLTLDFDLSRNFVFNGPVSHPPGVKGVLFTPVVRATNTSTAGSIQVDVYSDGFNPGTQDGGPIEGATVKIYEDGVLDTAPGDYLVQGPTDATGRVVFADLGPGTYDALVEATGHDSQEIQDLVVVIANLTTAEVTLEASGEITGSVMSDNATADTADDFSLEGVTVSLTLVGETTPVASTTTDVNGLWAFTGLDAGAYDLAFSKAGYVDGALTSVDAAFVSPGYPVLLAALTRDLAGTVTDTAGAVGGATVTVSTLLGDEAGSTTTATDGTWSLPGIPTRTYEVEFRHDDGGGTVRTTTIQVDVVGDATSSTQTLDVDLDA